MVKIRLRRVGKKKQTSFRVVVADSRSPRDGRFIETIGHYNPRTDPPTVVIKEDRALHWLSQGAQPTDAVERMLRNLGILEKLQQLRQGASIEELVAAPEPAVEEIEAEAEPAIEAEEVIGEAKAIAEAVPEAAEAREEVEAPALEEPEEPELVEETEEVSEVLEALAPGEMSLEELGLSTRVTNVLNEAGLQTVQDLLDTLAKGDAEFLSIPGAGGKALEEVRERLAEKGLLEPQEEGVA